MITRRGLLAGILAAGAAPAIVHNPMRIWVPRQDLWPGDLVSIDGQLNLLKQIAILELTEMMMQPRLLYPAPAGLFSVV